MEHIAALLLIVGCSGGTDNCQELPAPTPVFETAVECDEIMDQATRPFRTQFDSVRATCVQLDPALEYEDAELVWDITTEGKLVASIEPMSDYAIASNSESSDARKSN